jgi:hypothetical protein
MSLPGLSSSFDLHRILTASQFRRAGGGRVMRPRPAADTAAETGDEAAWNEDRATEASETPAVAAKAAEALVTLSAAWVEERVFFNAKAHAEVEAVLPPESAHLTRVELTLYAVHADGRRERLDSQDVSLKGGKARGEFTAYIPEARPGEDPPTECGYVFTARHSLSKEAESPGLKGESRPMGWLRLKLERAFQGPLADRKCILKIAGESHDLVTDANGVLAKFVPADATSAEILVPADEKNPKSLTFKVAIDKLDPPDRPEGARDRLDSMGYLPGPDAGRPTFRKAVEEFQCDCRLDLSGELDAATQGKLKEAFGC